MRALLDTQAFIWYVLDDPKLGGGAKSLINDGANEILVSPARATGSRRLRLPSGSTRLPFHSNSLAVEHRRESLHNPTDRSSRRGCAHLLCHDTIATPSIGCLSRRPSSR